MMFKKGDKVSVLDEDMTGVVKKVTDNIVIVETVDGFEMEFSPSELIKIENQSTLKKDAFLNIEMHEVVQEKELSTKTKASKISKKTRSQPVLEVDLHIHKLVDSTKGMANYDMLNLQVDTARQQLEFAMRKRIQRVVFIHGVGEGVLKMELETLFRRYDNVKFYDANLQEYGFGATEVYIYQNINP